MNEELGQAYALVLADLEERNSHTIGRLLEWDITGKEDEHLYRTWLVAKNYLYSEGQGLGSSFCPKNLVCCYTIMSVVGIIIEL